MSNVIEKFTSQSINNVNKYNFTWIIKNFSRASSKITAPSVIINKSDWHLELYPNGNGDECKDWISVLFYHSRGLAGKGWFTLAVLDRDNAPFFKESFHIMNAIHVRLVKRELIFKEHHKVLIDDTLRILCDVLVLPLDEESRPQVDLEKLYLNDRFSDVKLVAPCGRELPAHKNILALRSPVLSAMFDHNNMLENQTKKIEISDIRFDVLKEMLRYMYVNKVDNSMLKELYIAADKYSIEDLKCDCIAMLCNNLSVENVIETLELAEKYNEDQLKEWATNFVTENIKEVIVTNSYRVIADDNEFTCLLARIIRALALKYG